eukprot:gnl/MRDRNA2_/MRDRNA2_111736_c0_seq1.p1 gnl/MRDRNA2_/MRDRNA2_111736_c0~~gnl/MRDRNA2_/MRDRNA2_111736_c0_seq1.p1  ORF type:complete len:487 (-),score=68.95 gnl/MRDRNA2_/MRDRNA2_111736_c0_seq1:11-1471(-)
MFNTIAIIFSFFALRVHAKQEVVNSTKISDEKFIHLALNRWSLHGENLNSTALIRHWAPVSRPSASAHLPARNFPFPVSHPTLRSSRPIRPNADAETDETWKSAYTDDFEEGFAKGSYFDEEKMDSDWWEPRHPLDVHPNDREDTYWEKELWKALGRPGYRKVNKTQELLNWSKWDDKMLYVSKIPYFIPPGKFALVPMGEPVHSFFDSLAYGIQQLGFTEDGWSIRQRVGKFIAENPTHFLQGSYLKKWVNLYYDSNCTDYGRALVAADTEIVGGTVEMRVFSYIWRVNVAMFVWGNVEWIRHVKGVDQSESLGNVLIFSDDDGSFQAIVEGTEESIQAAAAKVAEEERVEAIKEAEEEARLIKEGREYQDRIHSQFLQSLDLTPEEYEEFGTLLESEYGGNISREATNASEAYNNALDELREFIGTKFTPGTEPRSRARGPGRLYARSHSNRVVHVALGLLMVSCAAFFFCCKLTRCERPLLTI